MYPQNEEVRRVLRAMVKKGQQLITTVGDHEWFKEIDVSYLALYDCWTFLIAPDGFADTTNSNILTSMLFNTPSRYKTYRKMKILPFRILVLFILLLNLAQIL